MEITQELVQEFKERMHIYHSSEDDNLKRLLSFSISALKNSCGEFDVNGEKDTDLRAKELVFERTRYLYNDALEYFEDNFLSEITSLGLSLLPEEDDLNATI
ncbi:phage gp6-like head-tail connector protein [Niallia sp. FSL W8-0951]|uniref:phage gp6-like head-tail connector protein n=1 Tax=Niallia sp. FSL W8-0951 TaxID=2954639 RepID=UPI004046BB4D